MKIRCNRLLAQRYILPRVQAGAWGRSKEKVGKVYFFTVIYFPNRRIIRIFILVNQTDN